MVVGQPSKICYVIKYCVCIVLVRLLSLSLILSLYSSEIIWIFFRWQVLFRRVEWGNYCPLVLESIGLYWEFSVSIKSESDMVGLCT